MANIDRFSILAPPPGSLARLAGAQRITQVTGCQVVKGSVSVTT